MKRTPHPVRAAYALAREDVPCPNCGAEPYVWCRRPDGEIQAVPCISRLAKPDNPRRDEYR